MPTTRKGDQGIFDELFEWIESLRALDKYHYGLEEHVLGLERVLQDLDDKKITNITTDRLAFWHELVAACDDKESAVTFFVDRVSRVLRFLLQWEGAATANYIARRIETIPPIPPDDWVPPKRGGQGLHAELLSDLREAVEAISKRSSEFDDMTLSLQQVTESLKGFTSPKSQSSTHTSFLASLKALFHKAKDWSGKIDHPEPKIPYGELDTPDLTSSATIAEQFHGSPVSSDQDRSLIIEQAKHVWHIDVKFLSPTARAADVGNFLWALGSAIEVVRDVALEVEEWGTGSLWIKLKLYIKNVWSRDEVQEVLAKARDGLVAEHFDQPIESVKKTQAERQKTIEETRTIERNLERLPDSSEAAELRRLEIEDKKLAIKEREVEVEHRQLECDLMTLDKIERASGLIQRGIIAADPVKIDINSFFYLSRTEGKTLPGTDISSIVAGEDELDNQDDGGREASS